MSNPAGLTKLEYFALSTQHPPSKPPPSTQLSRTTWSASMKPDREAEYQRGYDAGWAACAETFKMNGLNLDAMARLDKATELLRASAAHLEDCARDIVLRRAEEVLQARGNLALEMANRLRAFLAKHRKTGANDGK